MPLKKNTPGCPCCTPTGCDVTFVITACCGPAVGATVTVKDSGGTTKGTGTTNSSGSVTINLAGTSGQTLYVFVSYDATHYLQYTNVILGNHCGRTYAYTLTPVTETYGTACGTLTLKTTRCDGTTLLVSKAWTLQKSSAGGWTTYATGTTDATTAISTVTGLTYGGAYDYYRFNVTDATGSVTGTSINLTSANCVATCVMRMAISALLPCTTPQDAITYSGGGGSYQIQRACLPVCNASSIPGRLFLSGMPNWLAWNLNALVAPSSYTTAGACSPVTLRWINGSCTDAAWSSLSNYFRSTPWSENVSCGYKPAKWPPYICEFAFSDIFSNTTQTLYPWATLTYTGGNLTLTLLGLVFRWYKNATSNSGFYWLDSVRVAVAASSVTCSPFAATFSVPTWPTWSGDITGCTGTGTDAINRLPSATITVTE